MLKRPIPLIVAAVALIAVALLLRRCTSGSDVTYQTAPVTKGPITQAVTATGTLNPVQNVQVGSQVSGNIQKLFADFNTVVKAGQVIAQIDPVVFQANVNQLPGGPGRVLKQSPGPNSKQKHGTTVQLYVF